MSGRDHAGGRPDPLFPNAWLVARRELRERVKSRLFAVSTVLLSALAIGVALTPLFISLADRGSTTKIAVVASDDKLAANVISVMGPALNATTGNASSKPYVFEQAADNGAVADEVSSGEYDGALIVTRDSTQLLHFQFIAGDAIGPDKLQNIGTGALALALIDWTNRNRSDNPTSNFVMPTVDVQAAVNKSAGNAPLQASEFAARRIVGVVFVVLIFITLVIYGMWVAAGVVAEKSSRVMELLISAASPAQLVVGKVIGIGLAGLLQYAAIVVPAIATLLLEDRIAAVVLGGGSLTGMSLSVLTPQLLLAYGGFWILGFVLYSLIYAAAGSLVSRPEDLQVLALPLSLVAIVGYLEAVMALSGGISTFMRVSSFIPFWSPFVMLTRLAIGRADPWEVVAAYVLLLAAIAVVGVLAVRVYSAGVLLYGQRPGFRAIVNAVVNPPV
ncbi:MAG TPA: ABC transporter permease [Candidatus Limnocylindrales bacterium]